MYSRKQIEEITGLSGQFIHKTLKQLSPFFEGHTTREEHNRQSIDSFGLTLFQQIADMKGQGLALPEIKKRLVDLGVKANANEEKTGAKSEKTDLMREMFDDLKKERDRARDECRDIKQHADDLQAQVKNLQGEIKALPAPPEEMKKIWEEEQEKQKKIKELTQELKDCGFWSYKKRQKILKKLEDVL